MDQERRNLLRFPFKLPNSVTARKFGVSFSGALFALGFWLFIDCVLYSKVANGSDISVTFIDWIPTICSTLGMLIVSSIDKNWLLENSLATGALVGSSQRTWQAQTLLFFGFALLGGGVAGAFAVGFLKYISNGYGEYPTASMAVNNILGNLSIMASCIVLWMSQNIEDEYSYSLTL
ncbi:HBL293Wp [Eremothecium sinecaudum]|uniref:HBL293Wp n=1 Tax=Eremothecium sinecaudum TaxID=45286 RepID=A0A109UW56_9SACH|nr:HBL293Wp [Eremothecium sinecaudum]AMD18609.1 HBL293Wp [Eremothecium sinecaudum]